MNKVRILHTADLHIESALTAFKSAAEIRRAELLDIFGKIIDTAKSENVDVLIIAGDLFDSCRPSKPAVSYVKRKLESIPEVKVFITTGNHDYSLNIDFPENVFLFSNGIKKYEFESFDFYGAGFQSEYCDSNMLKNFSVENPGKINILAFHGDIVEKGQTSRYNPVTREELSETGADYVALGHVHQFTGINCVNNVSYAYCGIPEGRGFDELGKKGVIIGDVYKNRVDLKFLPVCKRECIETNIDITGCGDYDEICSKIYECAIGGQNIFKINLCGTVENQFFLNTNFIEERIKNDYFYVKVIDLTRPKIDIDMLKEEYSLRGLFVKKLSEQNGSEEALRFGLGAISGEKVYFNDN